MLHRKGKGVFMGSLGFLLAHLLGGHDEGEGSREDNWQGHDPVGLGKGCGEGTRKGSCSRAPGRDH